MDDFTTGNGVQSYADSLLLAKCYYWTINNGFINTTSFSLNCQAKAEYVAAVLTLFDSTSEADDISYLTTGLIDFDSSFAILQDLITANNYLYILADAVVADYSKTEYDSESDTWTVPTTTEE